MSKKTPLVVGILALVLVISASSLFAVVVLTGKPADNLSKSTASQSACDKQQQKEYKIVIQNNMANPSKVLGHQCDKLTIINQDDVVRDMAFGIHAYHTPYDGVTDTVLAKGDSVSVTLVQTGNFLVHDHDDDTVKASFTVQP